MFAVPNLLPWLGVRLSQRLGSVIQVPVLVIFPLLSLVNTAGYSVTTATTILLFTCYACSNSVGALRYRGKAVEQKHVRDCGVGFPAARRSLGLCLSELKTRYTLRFVSMIYYSYRFSDLVWLALPSAPEVLTVPW